MQNRLQKVKDHLVDVNVNSKTLNKERSRSKFLVSSNNNIERVPLIDIPCIISEVRAAFNKRASRSMSWRMNQLSQMLLMLNENEELFCSVLKKDLRRCSFETYFSEISYLTQELRKVMKCMEDWQLNKDMGPHLYLSNSYCKYEPLGMILIISSWNYPFIYTLLPLIYAIASGNCVILKLSEISQNCSNVLASIIPSYMDEVCIRIIEGGHEELKAIVTFKFDFIFYLGNNRFIRQLVCHSSSVGPEWDSKCPVLIDETANIELAAKRCLYGKILNCGQNSTAPDYVLLVSSIEKRFYEALYKAYQLFFPNGVSKSDDYGRIINDDQMVRLIRLLEEQECTRGRIIVGGETNRKEGFMSPTVLANTKPVSLLMQEEIFGPILPCLSVTSIDEAIEFVNQRTKPLAIYLFTSNSTRQQKVIQETSSRSVVINDALVDFSLTGHTPLEDNQSNFMGSYSERCSFGRFSHKKIIVSKSGHNIFDPLIRYPPYTQTKQWLTKKILG